MQLVHTEEVLPLSSMDGQVIAPTGYWRPTPIRLVGRSTGCLAITVNVFDSIQMNQDHRPGPDRILVAQLTGTARHHARWRELAQDEQDAAVTELRELAGGRADLLAEVAGIFEGASEGELDEPLARQATHLCRLAGADETLIPQWIAEGRHRAEAVRMRPHSGQPRSSRLPAPA